jgi:ElaB/YqjD/DUF883 family membrane-anchored ribosome-binding protein
MLDPLGAPPHRRSADSRLSFSERQEEWKMADKSDEKRIDEALELLNEVASDKMQQLQDRITQKYRNLKSALGGLQHDAQGSYVQGKEEVKEIASRIDGGLRKNPWPYLGGTAVGFLLLGLFLGRSRK